MGVYLGSTWKPQGFFQKDKLKKKKKKNFYGDTSTFSKCFVSFPKLGNVLDKPSGDHVLTWPTGAS